MRALTAFLFALPVILCAQTRADVGSFMYSDGVHPTLAVAFIGTDARSVSDFWKNELKGISIKVSDKKEVVGIAARIPTISPDTIRVYVKADQPKGTATVTVHIAFLTTAGFVGPDSPEREITAAKAYVEQHSAVLKRRIAQTTLENGRKQLSTLQSDLSGLQREKTRMEENIVKTRRKDEEALAEQKKAEEELPLQADKVEQLRKEMQTTPTEESEKLMKSAEREHTKIQDRIRRNGDASVSAKKKIADLEWEVKKNIKDQEAKQVAITKQEELVKEFERALTAVN